MRELFQSIAEKYGGFSCTDELLEDFTRWKEQVLFKKYCTDRMNKETVIKNEVAEYPSPFRNAKKGEEYSCAFTLPELIRDYELAGLEELGLQYSKDEAEPRKCVVSGTPAAVGEHEIILRYIYADWVEGLPKLERAFKLIVNPDPRDLWQDKPTDREIEYFKEDSATAFIPAGPEGAAKSIVAASVRGRSHAHEGKPRDDHFVIRRNAETGWSILVVADGAGSAPFSREGSRIAAETAARFCDEHIGELEAAECFMPFGAEPGNAERRAQVGRAAYNVLGNAAFEAHRAIREEAERRERGRKEYASTLLFAACKRFDFGWFIASFAVGDGAMAVIGEREGQPFAELLAEPDEGEFSGQTRFITMDDIFKDYESVQKRIGVRVAPDFTAVLLMTDGVSDAKFETDANLHDPEKWRALWSELPHGGPEEDGEAAKKNLLEWLNFWSPGNHDDRTLAFIY